MRFEEALKFFKISCIVPIEFLTLLTLIDLDRVLFNAWFKHGQIKAFFATVLISAAAPHSTDKFTLHPSQPIPTQNNKSNPKFLIV